MHVADVHSNGVDESVIIFINPSNNPLDLNKEESALTVSSGRVLNSNTTALNESKTFGEKRLETQILSQSGFYYKNYTSYYARFGAANNPWKSFPKAA